MLIRLPFLFSFQSESNLGLLWGEHRRSGTNEHIRWFQSESNLGLLWGYRRLADFFAPASRLGFNPNQISAYYGGQAKTSIKRSTLSFNPNQISAYYGGFWQILPGRLDCWCFNPNQISAYYGGWCFWPAVKPGKRFQSESNLGLLWGTIVIMLTLQVAISFNPNQISAYYGGLLFLTIAM